LTVMFCDLVGSTALSGQLDPEELREVLRSYQEAVAEVIRPFDGYIARYLGDGLLIYFGYPWAHEDDAQRAVRAGLATAARMPYLNSRLRQTLGAQQVAPLQVRIGIHTGLVVVGEMGSEDYRDPTAIVGETPNIAARLQEITEPDTVVISAPTHRLIEGFFACQDLGPHMLKGVSSPVPAYRVLGESGARGRLEVAATRGLTPLVGRDEEVSLLLKCWERAKEGEGQIVLLSGEGGIGKSRLAQVLKERSAGEGHLCLEARCSPYSQNSALYPVIDFLQRSLQFRREESPEEKLDKLVGALAAYDLVLPEVVPLLAGLLSLPAAQFPLPVPTPQKQREKTLHAILTWLLKVAERQPVLSVWEDLHWADPSTLELLGLLLEQAALSNLLVVLIFRPDFTPPWAHRSHMTPLALNRLGRRQVEAMVENLTGGKALPAEVVQQVVSKTDGVPLFVEELTKMVLESGLLREADGRYDLTGPLRPLAIPTTLQDSRMARLDRLGPVKEVAQLGATLGREFAYELLQAVWPGDEPNLQQAVSKLLDAEVLYQRGLPPQTRYVFKHALIQDAAYQSLLKSKRKQYHQQIARVLEERFPETKEVQPELLAHHYTEAGLSEQAIPYWQRAGQRASQRWAHVEAISHFTKGLQQLQLLPDTPTRAQQELTLQIALGPVLMASKGYAAPEVEQAFARARELCQRIGETPQLFPVLLGLRSFYTVRGEYHIARQLGEQLLRLAQRVQDPGLLLEAHHALGGTLYWMGEFASVREHVEQVLALYDPQQHRSHAFPSGQDPGVVCLSYTALILWKLGYPDQALRRSREASALAKELAHPLSQALALAMTAGFYQCLREGGLAQECAEALLTLSREQGFVYY